MSQNIYDQAEFFERYSRLNRSQHGLAGAPEWASLQAMLPDLSDKKVLDLGCGYGWFCRWALAQGATSVLGLDLSEKMLARARQDTPEPNIEYRQADLESGQLPSQAFDVVYSSLALHYVVHLPELLKQVAQSLTAGGQLIFSVEHPIFSASRQAGWLTHPLGHATWPVDQYSQEGPRITEWLGSRVTKQHRTVGTYVNSLIAAGLVLEHLEEWRPSAEQLAQVPELAEELERPMFLLLAARLPE